MQMDDGVINVDMGNSPRNNDVGDGDNVNDVLFQIDREYQAMKAVHEGNMGFNPAANMGSPIMGSPNNMGSANMHGEFLRDPPPASSGVPPHGHYRVVHEDDAYTNTSCGISGLMDFILPGSRRNKQQTRLPRSKSCSPRLSPRMGGFFDTSNNYSSSNPHSDPHFDERQYSTNFLCSRPRRERSPHNPVSSSHSEDHEVGSTSSSFDKAKKNVFELQSQLKAMVHDRARRQQAASPPGSPKEETRQEPTPPSSPPSKVDNVSVGKVAEKKDTKEEPKADASSKEMDILRQEQQSLSQARQMLQIEQATHQRNMAQMNAQYAMGVAPMATSPMAAPQYSHQQQQYLGNLCNPMGVAPLSPTAMAMPANTTVGMGMSPMILSPLTAHTAAVPSMPMTNGMHGMSNVGMNNGMANVMNNGMNNGMNGMNNGASGGLMGGNVNNGMMGNNNMGNNGMMGNTAMNNGTMNNGMMGNDANNIGMMGSNGMGNNGMNNGTMANGMSSGMNNGNMNNGTMGNNNMNNGMSDGMNNGTMNNTTNNGNMNRGMMGNNNMNDGKAMNNGVSNGLAGMQNDQVQQQTQQHQQPTPPPPQDVDANSVLQDANSILQRSIHIGGQTNDAKSVMSKSMFSAGGGGGGGERSEGKFIDNIGAYPLRPRVGAPTTPSSARRSPPSRPNTLARPDPSSRQPPGARYQPSARPQARAANMPSSSSIQPNNEEFAQSNHMLNDLKIKNALIRQDITRMKTCMGDTNKKNSPRGMNSPRGINAGMNGGVNVAGGMRVGPTKSSSRPFPRTSPTSSPNKQRYGFQAEDPITRAMQRSDDARSVRSSSNGSVATGIPNNKHRHPGQQQQQYHPSSQHHHRQQLQSHDRRPQQGGQQMQGEYSKRQPPSPLRVNKEWGPTNYRV